MTQPSAKIIADSISPAGHRLTTMEVTFHRFVLAEFNTHRVFSRNSASSRAIPVEKQLARVMSDPALPLSWPKEQRGMQGGEEFDPELIEQAKNLWLVARNAAVVYAKELATIGLHKSVVNRLLEPFMWHTAIVTSTEWDGFWAQRCSPLAQPEIRAVAEAMRHAYEESTPYQTPAGFEYWHLPYIDDNDKWDGTDDIETYKMVSAARCARVSYLTQDGRRDIVEDLKLYERLVTSDPPHWSPLEHVATPCTCREKSTGHEHLGNFVGFDQLRHRV